MKKLLATLALLVPVACMSPNLERVNTNLQETRQELAEEYLAAQVEMRTTIEAARTALFSKEITEAEYDAAVTAAQEAYQRRIELANEFAKGELESFPGRVKEAIEKDRDLNVANGKQWLFNLTNLLLLIGVGGGAGGAAVLGTQTYQTARRKREERLDISTEET